MTNPSMINSGHNIISRKCKNKQLFSKELKGNFVSTGTNKSLHFKKILIKYRSWKKIFIYYTFVFLIIITLPFICLHNYLAAFFCFLTKHLFNDGFCKCLVFLMSVHLLFNGERRKEKKNI